MTNASTKQSPQQRYKRYKLHADGSIISRKGEVAFTVEDVSLLGLKVHIQQAIDMNSNYAMRVSVGPLHNLEIIVRPIWDNDENSMGFEVLNEDPHWIKFIRLVEEGHFQNLSKVAG